MPAALSISKAKVAAALDGGIDAEDIQKYDEALQKFDQPNDSGNLGSYTQEEVYNALMSMALSDDKKSVLWQTTITSKTWNDYLEELAEKAKKAEEKAAEEKKKQEEKAKKAKEEARKKAAEEAKKKAEEAEKEKVRNDVGYTPVSSTVIAGYEYHNGVLTVTLNNGRTYSYNVSQETFDGFEAADSKGSFWNNYIK